MNTTHLKYVVEVEKLGSISKAAETLHMNQPQLSKAIRDMENAIGGPIFKRTSKGIIATAKGEEFIMHARNILNRTEAIENLYKMNDCDGLRFSFAVIRSSYIAKAFYNYMHSVDDKRKIDGAYKETSAEDVIVNVAVGESDIGIIRFNTKYEKYFLQFADEKDLTVKPIFEFEANILVSNDSPLAKEQIITDKMLQDGYVKVIYGDLSVPMLPVSKAAEIIAKKEEKKNLLIYNRQSQYEILTQFNNSYSFTSPVDPDILDRFALVQKKCDMKGITCKDMLVYRHDYNLTDADKTFISFIKKEIEKIG